MTPWFQQQFSITFFAFDDGFVIKVLPLILLLFAAFFDFLDLVHPSGFLLLLPLFFAFHQIFLGHGAFRPWLALE